MNLFIDFNTKKVQMASRWTNADTGEIVRRIQHTTGIDISCLNLDEEGK